MIPKEIRPINGRARTLFRGPGREDSAVWRFDRDERTMLEIMERDPRYALAAYEFTREALRCASGIVPTGEAHVSGAELLDAIRRLAIERFGLLTRDVLQSWGVRSTEDFGEIVFNLVDEGLLFKNDEDRREDFRQVFSFDEAFDAATYWQELIESSC